MSGQGGAESKTRKLQVLGAGCPKCRRLAANAERAARELGLQFELVKITGIQEIMRFGVAMTPALAVDGQVKVVGKAPSVDELKRLLA